MNKLTASQVKALEILKAGNFKKVVSKGFNYVKTGVNTTTLFNLRKMGFISCTGIYLSGMVTDDLQVIY